MRRRLVTVRGVAIAAVAGVVVLVAALCGAWVGWLQLFGNVHVEFGGDIVRTAQLDPATLSRLSAAYGVRTVLDLRGGHPGEERVDREIAAAKRVGARYVAIGLSATREPDEPTLARLLTTLRTAPRPILVHCSWGSDRTGLASALYGLVVKKLPAEVAARQLSFRYGHFPWLTSRTGAMDRTFRRVAAGKDAS